MWSWTVRSIWRGGLRAALLAVGLVVVTMGGLLVAAGSQTTLLTADRQLREYWRGSYDILVRPGGARSSIEEKYGLVEANHLSGIWGGISFQQYDAIRNIPGVEVAAPIATVGYVPNLFLTDSLGQLTASGAYLLEEQIVIDDGTQLYTDTIRTYYYADPSTTYGLAPTNGPVAQPLSSDVRAYLFTPLLLAGIDPQQEAALMGLEQALVEGQYIRANEPIQLGTYVGSLFKSGAPRIKVPALINVTPYVHLKLRTELWRLSLPDEQLGLDSIMAQGGNTYLATLGSELLNVQEFDDSQIYRWVLDSLRAGSGAEGDGLQASPAPVAYEETTPPFAYDGLALEVAIPEIRETAFGGPSYRKIITSGDVETQLDAVYRISAEGVFDIERLPKPADMTRVPLETYFPPVAQLRYDEQGRPVDPPRKVAPTLNPAGYIQPPPLLLTTLEAARALRGEDAISAIRIKVGRIEDLGPASQRKIEAVAIEIANSTDLDVDIMVGSSPSRVLVHVPGIGYVEEQWIKKGVNLVYREGIQAGSWLLIGAMLIAGALFALDLTWAEALAQRRQIALQKALGWRTRSVMAYLTGRLLLIGVTSVTVGTAGAWGLSRVVGWQAPALPLLLGLPALVLTLVCAAGLSLIWRASRVPPLPSIQQADVRHARRSLPARSLASYGWSNLMRRPSRTFLTAVTSALSAALLVLLLAVTLGQRGMLSGTLLGEFILVRVQGFHYAIVGIGFALAALSTANGLLGSLVERRHEIGVLKAVGWRSVSVARLFVLEGLLVGLAGGLVGALVGCGAGLYIYRELSPASVPIALIATGVAGLVGALAALYPARLAARVPPAEALRYE